MIGAFNEPATDNPIASSVRLAINSTHHPCSRLAARAARTPMAPQQIKRTLITAPNPTIVAFTPRNATTPATTNSTASNPRAMRPPRDDIIAPTITSLAAATKQNTPTSLARVATAAYAKCGIASPITIQITPTIRSAHQYRLFDARLLLKWSTRSCACFESVIAARTVLPIATAAQPICQWSWERRVLDSQHSSRSFRPSSDRGAYQPRSRPPPRRG